MREHYPQPYNGNIIEEPRNEAYIENICTILEEASNESRLLGYCGAYLYLRANPTYCYRDGRPLELEEDGSFVFCIRNYIVHRILMRTYYYEPSTAQTIIRNAVFRMLGFTTYGNDHSIELAEELFYFYRGNHVDECNQ